MSNQRFEVRFHPGAYKEYIDLDNSTAEIVDKALEEMEYRADEIGKNLRNNNDTKLAGCKEIKLRGAGIRIIYRDLSLGKKTRIVNNLKTERSFLFFWWMLCRKRHFIEISAKIQKPQSLAVVRCPMEPIMRFELTTLAL